MYLDGMFSVSNSISNDMSSKLYKATDNVLTTWWILDKAGNMKRAATTQIKAQKLKVVVTSTVRHRQCLHSKWLRFQIARIVKLDRANNERCGLIKKC